MVEALAGVFKLDQDRQQGCSAGARTRSKISRKGAALGPTCIDVDFVNVCQIQIVAHSMQT